MSQHDEECQSRPSVLSVVELVEHYERLQTAYVSLSLTMARLVEQAGGTVVLRTGGDPGPQHLVGAHLCDHRDDDNHESHRDCTLTLALHSGGPVDCARCTELGTQQAPITMPKTPTTPSSAPVDLSWVRPGSEEPN